MCEFQVAYDARERFGGISRGVHGGELSCFVDRQRRSCRVKDGGRHDGVAMVLCSSTKGH